MRQYIIVNNYVLGAYVKSMPQDKIVDKVRLDQHHTKITFDNLTKSERTLIARLIGSSHKYTNKYNGCK